MAGLYIHIPFCTGACHYCDFHFSISLGHLTPMLNAILKEIINRKDFVEGETLETIYLGGGTPSILSKAQLKSLLQTVKDHYEISTDPEITLEGNPEDLQPKYLDDLRKIGINRLSIGVQSFHEEELLFMNRRHGSKQSHECLEMAKKAGFDNLNVDLIYGLPGQLLTKWEENLEIATGYLPAHISAYHLTYEKGTVLDYRRKLNRFEPMDDLQSQEQYYLLLEKLEGNGYQHYEISNFAMPGRISRHNSGYWKGKKYLGVGPSAHSYNGRIRRWNMAKNASYIQSVNEGSVYYEQEELNEVTRFHDYLMTSMRTIWGTDLQFILREFGIGFKEHCLHQARPFLKTGKMKLEENKLILSHEGMFIADYIISEIFLVQD